MSPRILLSPPDVGPTEEAFVLGAMRSGWIAPLGPDVDAFERELADRVGAQHAVALSSGTAALHLGLLALGVEAGDLVLTSTLTFAATANAISYVNAIPYFVDVDSDTGNMSPVLLREALGSLRDEGRRIGAIIPVDLFGKSAHYEEILPIAREFEVPVLSDAAESLGATHRGRATGSFGQGSVFSFNGNKIMTTSGGGMFLTDCAPLADRVRYLSTQARQPVSYYEHAEIGFNYRLSNLLAALGRAQLSRLNTFLERRRRIREAYRQCVDRIDGVSILGGKGDAEDNCWLTSILIEPAHSRITPAAIIDAFAAVDIEARHVWKPMHLQPVFAESPGLIDGTAERLFFTGVTLPSGSTLTESDLATICGTLTLTFEKGTL